MKNKKTAIVMTLIDPSRDPRPNRMIALLLKDYRVTVLATKFSGRDVVEFIELQRRSSAERMLFLSNLLLRRHEQALWGTGLRRLNDVLSHRQFDLIVAHDMVLLPLAVAIKKQAKLVIDAREYYPRLFEDRLLWRLVFQPFNEYLAAHYLPKCDAMITVSQGIAEEYRDRYGINPEVVMSLPIYHHIEPHLTDGERIRIIHHGSASPSRRLELMIEMMDYVDNRFSLDLMLMPAIRKYYDKLVSMATSRRNVRVLPPVAYQDIITVTNAYDIGLYILPPTGFNARYSLPNKLFEFIQARLALAIGPSIEMARIVREWDCGIVSESFDPRSLAERLNELDSTQIMYYKNRAHEAARILNHENNVKQIEDMLGQVLQQEGTQ